jgi:hypothetical protein
MKRITDTGGETMATANSSWPMFRHALRQQQLMDDMMQVLGVDILTAVRADGGQAFVEARAKCRNCPHGNVCCRWLESPQATPFPPDFCPNAEFFRACGLLGQHGLWRERRED